MTVKNFLRGLGRRWYVVVSGLLITAVVSVYVASTVLPSYQRTASLLLMPGTSSVPEGENPYLYLGGLGQASDVLVNTMAAQTVRDPILDGYPATDFTVERNVTSSGPLLTVTVTGAADDVAEVLDRSLSGVESTLDSLQSRADVPLVDRITTLPLATDEASTVIQRNRIEAVVATAAAGVALTLLLTGFIDGLLLSRARRRRLPAGSAPTGTASTSTAPTSTASTSTAEPEPAPADPSVPDELVLVGAAATHPDDAGERMPSRRQTARATEHAE